MLPRLNSNLMFPIPKIEGAVKDEEFKSIVLSNFVFKVVTKILTNRLGNNTSRIISQNSMVLSRIAIFMRLLLSLQKGSTLENAALVEIWL